MQQRPTFIRVILAHAAGILCYLLIAIAGTLAYLLFYKATGPRVEPLVGGAIVVFLPMLLTGLGLCWAIVWGILKWRRGRVSPKQAAGISAGMAVLGMVVICGGLGCFLGGKSEHYVGWFFTASAALATAAHSAIYRRITTQVVTV